MYTIEPITIPTKAAPYQAYRLQDSITKAGVTVVPERGGIITSLSVDGREWLYLDTERFQDPNLSVRGGIPILFPICGNLPNDQYTWNGQTYTLPQHGFARTLPWTISDQQATAAAASLTLTLTDSAATHAVYPFAFTFTLTYTWAQGGLAIAAQIHNPSPDVPLPFCLGYHPYFAAPRKADLAFHLPTTTYYDRANDEQGDCRQGWDWQKAEIDAALTPLPPETPLTATVKTGSVQTGNVKTATTNTPTAETPTAETSNLASLAITADPAFRHLVFWTVADKPFYCLEPWTAPRNALNSGEDLQMVDPGQTLNLSMHLQIVS